MVRLMQLPRRNVSHREESGEHQNTHRSRWSRRGGRDRDRARLHRADAVDGTDAGSAAEPAGRVPVRPHRTGRRADCVKWHDRDTGKLDEPARQQRAAFAKRQADHRLAGNTKYFGGTTNHGARAGHIRHAGHISHTGYTDHAGYISHTGHTDHAGCTSHARRGADQCRAGRNGDHSVPSGYGSFDDATGDSGLAASGTTRSSDARSSAAAAVHNAAGTTSAGNTASAAVAEQPREIEQ